ncbi:PaaX family transcriptional regulator [Roseibium sediminicola]|uniref:PaaX family transcriptional regulator n=1 Tax=Roseibium sediminicola TaxID=2933272 RepID=A0ABT0GPJ9_9HYPH|nr:PaaX family transcriptional regulator C-terminal domain-containing protein [Roseibium sp. CAU 1639]MCK7611347.1 PaaX family transcriptional regulator [Roseibium sp. CAU 1639]
MLSSADKTADRFLVPSPPKAAQLIVTIYGDIVEPRGGVLWMGDLISLCAGFGVNESLVRTAVSRLVSKGQLVGEREGRRSYYGLTAAAREEYHLAADLFFGPVDGDCGWLLTLCTDPAEQAVLTRNGFVQLSGSIYAASDRPGRPVLGTAFRAQMLEPDDGKLRSMVTAAFQLDGLATDYSAFVSRFADMASGVTDELAPETALLYRLALVHAYREIRLRDPRLPVSALPDNWPGVVARSLFADLYRRLSDQADAYIGQNLLAKHGPLPTAPEAVRDRIATLMSSL